MLQDRLRELRTQKHLTQEQVADKLGITRPAYTAYEAGKRQPDYSSLRQLADLYGVTTDYLLGQNDTPKWATEKDSLDLKEVLEGNVQPSFNFGGEDITDDDRAKLNLAITQIFWKKLAKQRKKAERDGK
ncbi:helix-turn-helix domain-containing protein [Lacticaseibacillus suibinensis]|uniref:helix-turn-helix domain-containing protein n=1 Tax=Lacticaseibacillus suibinensis TaxID=2486011 RepID=UPI000F77BF07|nr:helix-turn-helix transcriptional regulator [Lacticaseibacillus suibinensis]